MQRLEEMLNVARGEKFMLTTPDGEKFDRFIYQFDEFDFLQRGEDGDFSDIEKEFISDIVLKGLTARIIPYKPVVGEVYYYMMSSEGIGNIVWNNTIYDYINYYVGNCFRTAEQVKKHHKEIYKKLVDKYESI